MQAKKHILLAGMLTLLIAGCQKTPEPKTVTGTGVDPSPGTPAAAASAPPGGSVALPQDKMPASDAGIPPAAQGTPNSGDANTPSQANPSALQKHQEQSGMPHTGQTNNYSAPETVGTASGK